MTLHIPIMLYSEANQREHYMAKARRVKWQRHTVMTFLVFNIPRRRPPRKAVLLTRLMGKRQREFDDDNIRSAFKAVRDAVAKYFRVDDGKRCPWTWAYGQERAEDGVPGVRISW